MSKLLSVTGFSIVFLVGVAILSYLVLLGASHAYVSKEVSDSTISAMSVPWGFYGELTKLGVPGLTDYGLIFVEEVNVLHALRNLIFLMSTAALATLAPLFFIVVGGALALRGLFMGDWGDFLSGLAGYVIGFILSVLAILLSIVVSWLVLLFQPSTPAYTITWLLGIIPFTLLGGASGASPYIIIVIVIQK